MHKFIKQCEKQKEGLYLVIIIDHGVIGISIPISSPSIESSPIESKSGPSIPVVDQFCQHWFADCSVKQPRDRIIQKKNQ